VDAICRDYAVQVSDRRLSIDGVMRGDESNKAALLFATDARMIVGFTGIAKAGSFTTAHWILDTLKNCD